MALWANLFLLLCFIIMVKPPGVLLVFFFFLEAEYTTVHAVNNNENIESQNRNPVWGNMMLCSLLYILYFFKLSVYKLGIAKLTFWLAAAYSQPLCHN